MRLISFQFLWNVENIEKSLIIAQIYKFNEKKFSPSRKPFFLAVYSIDLKDWKQFYQEASTIHANLSDDKFALKVEDFLLEKSKRNRLGFYKGFQIYQDLDSYCKFNLADSEKNLNDSFSSDSEDEDGYEENYDECAAYNSEEESDEKFYGLK